MFMKQPILCFVIFTNFPALFSIRFDEYYDSDGSALDRFPCYQIGINCRSTEECCGVANCVLPSWSPNPVCLVAGYKQAFQYMISNTSFYNHFNKKKYTSSSPIEVENSLTSQAQNICSGNEGGYSGDDTPKELITKNFTHSKLLNSTSSESNFIIPSRFVAESDVRFKASTLRLPSKSSESMSDLNKSLNELNLTIMRQHKLLLLNSSVKETAMQSRMNEIYEDFKNSDMTKVLVQLLKEKVKRLNIQEAHLREDDIIGQSQLKHLKSAEVTKPTSKPSKWSLVRALFLHKKKITNYQNSFEATNNVEEQTKFRKKIDTAGELESLINQFYIKEEKDSVLTDNANSDQHTTNLDNNIIHLANINNPYRINKLNKEKDTTNNRKYLKIDETMRQNKTITENILNKSRRQNTFVPSLPKNIEPIKTDRNSTLAKPHFWKTIAVWPVGKNISTKLTSPFKNIFIWKKKTTSFKKREPFQKTLNERFIFTLNSKNGSMMSTETECEETEGKREQTIPSEDSSSGYSSEYSYSLDSVSSDTEELYNNSFVFMVHNRNLSSSLGKNKWRSFLDFFHITKVIPCPEDRNPCVDPTGNNCSCTKLNRLDSGENGLEVTTNSTTVPKVIRLPENLMPEALERRHLNESDFLFLEDSLEVEEKSVEHNSSSTFFFFFRQ